MSGLNSFQRGDGKSNVSAGKVRRITAEWLDPETAPVERQKCSPDRPVLMAISRVISNVE